MPSTGLIKHSEANAKKVQVLALQAKNAIDGLLIINELRNDGVIDFDAIDYSTHPELGAFSGSDFNKALDNAVNIRDNGAIGSLVKVIKMY